MASRLFFAAVLGLLQLSLGEPSTWTARLLSMEEINNTNMTDMEPTTTTTPTPNSTLSPTPTPTPTPTPSPKKEEVAYQQVVGTMVLDVDDPVSFVADPDGKARAAIATSLAEQLTGVDEDMINVTLGLEDARRLASGRALANQTDQFVVVTYVITLTGSDASAAAELGNDIMTAINAINTTSMKSSLDDEFVAQGLTVTLEYIVIDPPTSQAVSADGVVIPSPTPSPTPSPNPTPGGAPSPNPTPTPSPTPNPTPGSGDDEEDGSVRPGPACVLVFGLLALLRTSQA